MFKIIYKISLIFIVALFVLLIGCKSDNEEVAKLKKEIQTMQEESAIKNDYIDQATQTLYEIHDTLNQIQGKINLYQKGIEANKPDIKQDIFTSIDGLKDLLKSNKQKINELQKKLKENSIKIAGLDALIEKYQLILEQKDKEIADLNDYIKGLKSTIQFQENTIAQQKSELQSKDVAIEEKEYKSNSLFYIFDEETKLIDDGYLVKKGTWPFRQIFLTEKPNEDNFTKIDLRKNQAIVINKSANEDFSNVKLYPARDASSYSLEKIDDNSFKLIIKNPEAFLKISKYLVLTCD